MEDQRAQKNLISDTATVYHFHFVFFFRALFCLVVFAALCFSVARWEKNPVEAQRRIYKMHTHLGEKLTQTRTHLKKKPGIPGNQMEFFSFRIECELYLQSVFFFFASHIYQLVEFALTHFRHPVEWNLASAQDRGESMEQHIAPA